MYQFNLSVDKERKSWIEGIEKILSIRFRELGGVVASVKRGGRVELATACEQRFKQKASEIIKKTLVEMFLTLAKYDYLSKNLKISSLSDSCTNVLIHTLVAFDRESEEEIIEKKLAIQKQLALDGFFNFRLLELKRRWDEIIGLASSNAKYLSSTKTLDELLRFLLSAITPKVKRLAVTTNKNFFSVKGEYCKSPFELKIISPEQLLIYLINVAPLELTLEGEFKDKSLYNRIVAIFDGKGI